MRRRGKEEKRRRVIVKMIRTKSSVGCGTSVDGENQKQLEGSCID
jgi:hypothetical protein